MIIQNHTKKKKSALLCLGSLQKTKKKVGLLVIRRSAHLNCTVPSFICESLYLAICTNYTLTHIRQLFQMISGFPFSLGERLSIRAEHFQHALETKLIQKESGAKRNCCSVPPSSHFSIRDACHCCCRTPNRARTQAIYTNTSVLQLCYLNKRESHNLATLLHRIPGH